MKIEATSFGVSEPHETIAVRSMLSNILGDSLPDEGCGSFEIPAMTIERILADKVFGAESYLRRGDLFDCAKHMYDLSVMAGEPRIQALVCDPGEANRFLAYSREEESVRYGSTVAGIDLDNAGFFGIVRDPEWVSEFERMQDAYVFDDRFRFSPNEISARLEPVFEICRNDTHVRNAVGPKAIGREAGMIAAPIPEAHGGPLQVSPKGRR